MVASCEPDRAAASSNAKPARRRLDALPPTGSRSFYHADHALAPREPGDALSDAQRAGAEAHVAQHPAAPTTRLRQLRARLNDRPFDDASFAARTGTR